MILHIKKLLLKNIIVRSLNIFSKKERIKILLVVLIQIFLGLLDLIGIVFIGIIGSLAITGVSSRAPGNRTNAFLDQLMLADKTLQQQVAILGLIAVAILVGKTILSLYFTRRILFFLSRRAAKLSSELISKLLSKPLLFVQEKTLQQSIFAVTTGVTSITVGILGSAVYLISDIFLLIILTTGLFIVNTLIAISTLLIFSIVGFALYRIMHVKVKNLGEAQANLSIKSNEKIAEVLTSYRELVVRNRRNYYASEIGEIRYKLSNVMAENTFYQNISKYALEITMVIGALVISAVQFQTQTASHAVAVLAIFLAASTRIGPAVLRVQQSLLSIRGNIGASSPTLDLIDELKDTAPLLNSSENFEFNHVGFDASIWVDGVSIKYPTKNINAINNLSLCIKTGSTVAIVGPSGAGKTTLVDLILGIISPDSGNVSISGKSPLDSIATWPGAISYVPQDIQIINGSIAENISMGYQSNSQFIERINNSIKVANLDEFVSQLELGINTQVGDRGTKLSGGQRQRLGIARAMFTSPKLLILDEATSSLDGKTEFDINESIQNLRGSTTVLMIAHRLSTVRNADLVVYLEKGELLAVGSFTEVRNLIPDFDKQAKLMGL
jgi:ABC-type multidrug transport system fused ATPase/permease subunit